MLTDRSEHLSTKQAAARLGVSEKWLLRARGARKGPPYYRVGGRIVYLLDDIRVWFKACRAQ